MEMIICPGCLESVGKDVLECPVCGCDLLEESFEEEREEEADELVDEEPAGPEPVEYKPVLIFVIAFVLGAWAWHALSDHASVLLK